MSKIKKIKVNNVDYDLGVDYSNVDNKPDLSLKQDTLVSGENIKTINGSSILGSGNLVIEGGEGGLSSVAHDDTLTGTGTNANPLGVDSSKFQSPLVSGTNIKTINNQSILGEGNITIEGGSGEGLSTEVKNAILDCFEHVAWIDTHGQDYYDALEELFFPAKTLVSISAVFNQGSNVIYDNASLDSLKQYLTVTANYDDSSTETVTNYSLSGTLSAGTSTITVTYQGKTTTFNVSVTAVPTLASIAATYTQTGAVYASDSLDSLKSDLVVKAIYTDASEVTLSDSDYTLSGSLTAGTSTITVSYSGKTTTFTVVVTAVVVTSIDAVFTQGSAEITTNNTLNDLKQYLTVTAAYNNGTTSTVASADYTLSGTLTEGTSIITVTYEGQTDTFDVAVTEVRYVTDGLMAFWDGINNNGSAHDSSATKWVDTINGYEFVQNGTSRTYSFGENCLNFTTASGSSEAPNNTLKCANIGLSRTVEVVFETTGTTAQCIGDLSGADFGNNNEQNRHSFSVFPSDGTVMVKGGTSDGNMQSDGVSNVRSLCGVYDTSHNCTGYINGSLGTAGTHTHSFSGKTTGYMIIGASQNNYAYSFKGKIYAIRIYNRELTPQEISANYATDVVRYGLGA